MKKVFVTFLLTLSFIYNSEGYDNKTAHRDFNAAIVDKFKNVATAWTDFKNYNFSFEQVKITGPAVTEPGYLIVKTEDRNFTLKEWIVEGGYSADEPEVPAAYRHFYDPIANDGKTHLTDINMATSKFNPSVDAIYWHFMGNDVNGTNEWTWHVAKDYMGKAITSSDEKFRNLYLAKAFRALGEVLHNTADMGCPPHVRNDAHGGFGLGGSDPYEGGFQTSWIASFSGNTCDASLKSQFVAAPGAMEVNKQLAVFTNKYFFSDETISGNGADTYNSRNGKKDFPNPKLDKLTYETESFNYIYSFPSGRKVQMCNDQSVLLGFLTTNYRSYPRVTLQNAESQASELVPAILEAGTHVMRHFFPVLSISLEIKPQDKIIEGTIKHKATDEYPNSLNYNGKVSFLVDGKTSTVTASASNGKFTVTETDKKFPGATKITAYIELAGIIIKSGEYDFNAVTNYNYCDFGVTVATKMKSTNQVTNEVINYPVSNAWGGGALSYSTGLTKKDNVYSGSWNITDKNPKDDGSIKITLDGEKTVTVEYSRNLTWANGDYENATVVTKTIPFGYKASGQIIFSSDNAFLSISQFSFKKKVGNLIYESTLVEKDVNNLTGGVSVMLYIK